jgi:hypothetical protein
MQLINIIRTVSLNTYYWRKYQDNDKDIFYSGKWNWPMLAFFWLKASLTIVAYVFLLYYVYSQIGLFPIRGSDAQAV